MTAAPKKDIVYALHDFEAENEDELSFQMGEEIVVLERDDQYGDGWFSGRNAAGETGLFPQSYTSVTRPELEPESPPPATNHPTNNGPHTPVDSVLATSAQVDQTLTHLGASSNTDGASIRSRTSRRGDSDDDLPNANNHRANLAARAVAEVAAQQKEREDQLSKRRKADEEAYELARQKGIIDGLQLSEESDEDEVHDALVPPTTQKAPPITKAPSIKAESTAVSPTLSATGGAPLTKQRSRADTIASNYAESTYSAPGSPPVPTLPLSANSDSIADFQALAAEPGARYSTLLDNQTEELSPDLTKTPSAPTKFEHAQAEAAPEPEAQSTPVQPSSSSFKPAEAIEAAIGATVTGVAAAAAAVAGFGTNPAADEEGPSAVPDKVGPVEAEPTVAIHPSDSVTALPTITASESGATTPHTNGYTNGTLSTATLDPPAPSSISARSLTTPPPLDVRASVLGGPGSAQAVSSPAASVTSSGIRPGSAAGPIDPNLPFDPRTWDVDEVVNWASSRGFDDLTVSKFKEHEISGDVLLELDVALLKEIDLPAFGRRVHIYNAIKELKMRVGPTSSHSTRPGSILSASMSGYDADSPATTMSYATPLQGSFISPVPGFNNFAAGGFNSQNGGSSITGSQDGDVQGLGFEENSRPGSAASQSVRAVRSRSALSATGGHTRSATLNTTSSNGLEPNIVEETEEADANAAEPTVVPEARPPRLRKASTRMSIHRGKGQSGDDRSGSSSPSSPSLTAGGKTPKTDRSSFFGATIGRSRKPPPKVPSTLSLDTAAGSGAVPRPRQSNQNNAAKRSTRLFSSFGSSNEKSPILTSRRSIMSPSTKERDGPSSMSTKAVDAATAEMVPKQQAAVRAGDLMEKLGTPEYSGWMRKKGEKYNGWKQRFLVLKGLHLYWLKSESEQRVKGFINLTGYRVISDPDIHPGEFGFKIVHDTDRAHHFSAAEQVTVRNWMKEIMKATIGRDYSAPVVSSCDMDTLPLKIAQTMNPRPRPPSPTERAQIQKERYAGTNPNTLSAKDAQILMEFAPGSPLMTSPVLGGTPSPSLGGGGSRLSMMSFPKGSTSPVQRNSGLVKSLHVDDLAGSAATTPGDKTPTSPKSAAPVAPTTTTAAAAAVPAVASASAGHKTDTQLLEWVNGRLPVSVPAVSDLGDSLRSGRVLTRLLEELSGENSGISDADFAAYREPGAGGDFDAAYFDCVFNVFDFITPIISTDGIAMDDMLRGNQPLLEMLLTRYREKYP